MRATKFSIGATIPTVQYGNLQPVVEVELEGATLDEARDMIMPQIQMLWDQYGERPLKKQITVDMGVELECFTGGTIWFNKETHTYYSQNGAEYLSASVFARQDEKPFDVAKISEAMAKRDGKTPQFYVDQWELKRDVAGGFGTAIHGALELFGTYGVLHDNPTLRKPVEAFFKGREKEVAVYEALVANHDRLRCGMIDRLLIVDEKKKIARVQDYKTDADLTKRIKSYWKQLNFYTEVLADAGWKMQPPEIYHWTGEKWEMHNEKSPIITKIKKAAPAKKAVAKKK